MIESWNLQNFKSVVDKTTLPFAPLTLFTGANSAGKSTIIQSILLTAQTIQSSVYVRPVVLNGHIARLGSFKDLVSGGDLSTSIGIGFTLSGGDPTNDRVVRHAHSLQRRKRAFAERGVTSVSCEYRFSVPAEKTGSSSDLFLLQPQLEEMRLSAAGSEGGKARKAELTVVRTKKSTESRLSDYQIGAEGLLVASDEALKFEATTTASLDQGPRGRNISREVVGASLSHFLPRYLLIRYDQIDVRVARQIEAIVDQYAYRDPNAISEADASLSSNAVELLVNVLRQAAQGMPNELPLGVADSRSASRIAEAVKALETNKDVRVFTRLFRLLRPQEVSQIVAHLPGKQNDLKTALRGGAEAQYVLSAHQVPDLLQGGVDVVQDTFTRLVKYLGPLRDEPKPVYPLSGGTDPADVGFRGEHTAAVLDLHKFEIVEYVPSHHFDTDSAQPIVEHSTLSSAVLDWLRYMGVGTDFFTSDLGKLGHELRITTTDSSLQHDLTQVGVGVSQLLPILVLALLAERGSILIFEQPELHLHPKVQTRLADFFVAMTLLGKQCIVETHSEYLITRLRYRVVASEEGQLTKSIKLYFVEKSGFKSSYRAVSINDLGMIEDWPSGFFDESETGTADLLRKGLAKRRGAKKG